MTAKRILVVEPDAPFALTIAGVLRDAGWITALAASGGEAELEIASRRPDLVVMRAELPDLSGFSVCAQLRHDRATARLPVIVYSSDTAPASLAEHARTPWAASAYLAMPLDTDALGVMARRLLQAAEPIELADDADIEELPGEGQAAEAAPAAPPPPPTVAPPPLAPAGSLPPPVPRRVRREALTEEDRLFVGRVFQSIADRRDALAADAERHRPPPRRDQLASPEGRLALLREDLKWREAQLARLSEVWEVREREVASVDERVHAKDVEVQRTRTEAEELRQRLDEAYRQLAEKDREHGASIEGLLAEKFKDENEVIGVVAKSERRLHELERELRGRDERLAQQAEEAAGLRGAIGVLEGDGLAARQREAELHGQIEGLQRAALEAEERQAEAGEQLEARDALLRGARREVERLQAELSAARQALMLRETELRAEAGRARADVEEVSGLLAHASHERDELQARLASVNDDLAASRAEAGALGQGLETTRARLEALQAEPTVMERLPATPAPPPAAASGPGPASEH